MRAMMLGWPSKNVPPSRPVNFVAMYEIVERLAGKGFDLSPRRRGRLIDLLAKLFDGGIELKDAATAHMWLSPSVVRNVEESRLFREALDEYYRASREKGSQDQQ